MRLEGEAEQAGGAVHVLLGNHEVMNLVGDLRYVSRGGVRSLRGAGRRALREQAWQKPFRKRSPASERR